MWVRPLPDVKIVALCCVFVSADFAFLCLFVAQCSNALQWCRSLYMVHAINLKSSLTVIERHFNLQSSPI